jgi:hypothetical protein
MPRHQLHPFSSIVTTLARFVRLPRLPQRVRRKPSLEILEDRRVPATFAPSAAVTDGADGSLRAVVLAASGNGQDNTINLEANPYVLTAATTILGTDNAGVTGDLDLSGAGHTLTIQGAGPDQTIIDANHIDRAFHVSANVTVVFRNLTITGGSAVDAGDFLPSASRTRWVAAS